MKNNKRFKLKKNISKNLNLKNANNAKASI